MTYTIRNFRFDDLPALVEIINRAAQKDQDDSQTTLHDLETNFRRPYFGPEQNCLVALNADEDVVGYVTADLDPRYGKGWGVGCVDPAYRRQGIGTALLKAADARHMERAEKELPAEMGLYVTRYCRGTSTPTRTLFEAADYAVWRVTWIMHIDFDDTLNAIPLPEGFSLRPFERARDERLVWAMEGEIFENAPGYRQPPFEVWETYMFPPIHDDSLWLLAVDTQSEDKPDAGLCLCMPKHDKPGTGWVELFGVREAYRGKGLGSALLQQGFRVMKEHGFTAAELSVDSENKDNAVALYERGGMKASRTYPVYRKIIREAVPN